MLKLIIIYFALLFLYFVLFISGGVPNNDRIINNTNEIKKIVIKNNGVVLDTYSLNNIKYQFSILNDCDIIILDYGSSFYFNCMFLKNKKILLIDDGCNNFRGNQQYNGYSFHRYLCNKIAENNSITFIKTTELELIDNLTKY